MKNTYIKKIKPCFAKTKYFFKEREEDCKKCQFKRKCLLEIDKIKRKRYYEKKNKM